MIGVTIIIDHTRGISYAMTNNPKRWVNQMPQLLNKGKSKTFINRVDPRLEPGPKRGMVNDGQYSTIVRDMVDSQVIDTSDRGFKSPKAKIETKQSNYVLLLVGGGA